MHAVDLTGLSTADALSVVTRDINRAVSDGLDYLDRCEQMLRDFGADSEELYLKVEHERAELIAWREKSLAQLRGWLARDGAALN
jgi:hypothetical protein